MLLWWWSAGVKDGNWAINWAVVRWNSSNQLQAIGFAYDDKTFGVDLKMIALLRRWPADSVRMGVDWRTPQVWLSQTATYNKTKGKFLLSNYLACNGVNSLTQTQTFNSNQLSKFTHLMCLSRFDEGDLLVRFWCFWKCSESKLKELKVQLVLCTVTLICFSQPKDSLVKSLYFPNDFVVTWSHLCTGQLVCGS